MSHLLHLYCCTRFKKRLLAVHPRHWMVNITLAARTERNFLYESIDLLAFRVSLQNLYSL